LAALCLTAAALGFAAPCANSLDAVSDRDFAIECCAAAATLMMHLSRIAEELIIWNSAADIDSGNSGHRPNIKGGYFPVAPVDSLHDLRATVASAPQRPYLFNDTLRANLLLAPAQVALGRVRRFGDRFEDAYACITHGTVSRRGVGVVELPSEFRDLLVHTVPSGPFAR